ncbi:nitrogen permease regulator 2 [Ascobolus immersus RN42]|uniref:Nitrogen permease regulator 2 n=1 Tax=Ascobolus immersus RN42 TaxID=1160509 RepID=A0A3N4IHR0_ASCIM|nr:nitrogen permease regulator 2 [Ascobolus immersus RN42]
MTISAIFFTHFDPKLGPKVLVEHPPHSITPFPPPEQLPPPHPAFPDLIENERRPPLIPIDLLTDFLIPKQTLCDRLVSVVYGDYRILSYPVRIEAGRYDRNEYIFTLSVVVHVNVEFSPYPGMVTKIAKMLRAMEEQCGWISTEVKELERMRKKREERIKLKMEEKERKEGKYAGYDYYGTEEKPDVAIGPDGTEGHLGLEGALEDKMDEEKREAKDEDDQSEVVVTWNVGLDGDADGWDYEWWADICGHGSDMGQLYYILKSVMEDLNEYGECCVAIDDSNTISLKLIRKRAPPVPIKPFHVPHPTVPLARYLDSKATDLTLLRVIPHINGLNTMARIAQLADADYNLTRKCVQHLLYYDLVKLIPPILFHGIFSTTSRFTDFITNKHLLKECLRYLAIPTYTNHPTIPLPAEPNALKKIPTPADLVHFYSNLRHGLTLRDWYIEMKAWKYDFDHRRLIAFGLLHGFLYRVQKYMLLDPMVDENGNEIFGRDYGPHTRFLTGSKCLDEVCLEMNMAEREAILFLDEKTGGNCVVIHR